jgi:hypothetical protein
MRRFVKSALLAGLLGMLVPGFVSAQFLEVGAQAPDIELQIADADGVKDGVSTLSEYRGEVIVLAFFFRARTSG